MSISEIPVFVSRTGKVLDKEVSNIKGVFHLTWNDGNDRTSNPYLFYCIIKRDTFQIASIKSFASDTPELTFTLPTYASVMLRTKVD